MASSADPLSGLAAATPGSSRGNGGSNSNPGTLPVPTHTATQTGLTAATPAGGANALNAAPDQSALATDPAYLAYMRAIGLSNANDQATAQQNIDAQNSALAVRIPLLQADQAMQSQNAIGRLEARGVLEGGGAANQMGQLASQQQAVIAGNQAATAQKVATINQMLQAQELANQTKLSEQTNVAAGKVGLGMGASQLSTAINNISAGPASQGVAVGGAGAAPGA